MNAFRMILVWSLAMYGVLSAASPFEEGNNLFREGRFKEAEAAYNRSLAEDGDTAATRYNLGRVREALADPAGAMVEWERAIRLSPKDHASLNALTLARLAFGSRVESVMWWQQLQPDASRGRERWLFAGALWLAIGGVVLRVVRRRKIWGAALIGLGVLGAAFSGAWWQRSFSELDVALVIERSVGVRVAPADPARLIETLPAGSRVQVLDESGGWNRIRIPGGQTGWLPVRSIERL